MIEKQSRHRHLALQEHHQPVVELRPGVQIFRCYSKRKADDLLAKPSANGNSANGRSTIDLMEELDIDEGSQHGLDFKVVETAIVMVLESPKDETGTFQM